MDDKPLKPGKDYIGVGGGILIFNKNGEVLLLKRGKNSKNEAGWWQKPGGTLEYGEKMIGAMKREVKEETDIEVDVWGYLPHTDHILKKENQHWIAINYLADIKSGTPKIMEPGKHDKIEWFNLKRLPKLTNKTTRESIKNFLAGRFIKIR